MKNIVLITCLFLVVITTACSPHKEVTAVTMTVQTNEVATQTLAEIPSKTPTLTPTPVPTATAKERIATHGFPKLYNQYQAGYPSGAKLIDMERLSLWDVITVDAESLATVEYLSGPSGVLRAANSNLVITVYFSAGNSEPTDEGIFGRFNEGLQPNWLLRDVNSTLVKGYKFERGWSGYYNLSATGITEYFADFIQRELIETELFDGVFYDWGASSEFSWLNFQNEVQYDGGRIDLNQDGVDETDQQIDSAMRSAMRNLHVKSRDRWGDEILILGNGGPGSTPDYVTTLNGNMTECFQSNRDAGAWEQLRNSWSSHMMTYSSYALQAQEPRIAINLVCGRQNPDNFALMRFTLASTLLFDGYFAFAGSEEPGGADYDSTWWYDEYSVNTQTGVAVEAPEYKGYLGEALGPAVNAVEPTEQLVDTLGIGSGLVDFTNKMAETKVWRRDFEHGIVLVNPTSTSETIDLGGTFRKIQGTRDPAFNDGSEVNTIVLPPMSGVILLRP